jgi:peptidase E
MTKYILNSGGLKNQPDRARKFMAETTSGLGNDIKLLLCFFAEPDISTWPTRFETMSRLLQEWSPEGVTLRSLATDYEHFEQQVKENDAVYLHGGITDHAVKVFSQYDLPKVFAGKVVASNSAATHMFSESFWSADERTLGHGLNVVPIRTIAHYKSHFGDDDPRGPIDWQKAYDELKAYGDTSLPIYALEEGEFIVRELYE